MLTMSVSVKRFVRGCLDRDAVVTGNVVRFESSNRPIEAAMSPDGSVTVTSPEVPGVSVVVPPPNGDGMTFSKRVNAAVRFVVEAWHAAFDDRCEKSRRARGERPPFVIPSPRV